MTHLDSWVSAVDEGGLNCDHLFWRLGRAFPKQYRQETERFGVLQVFGPTADVEVLVGRTKSKQFVAIEVRNGVVANTVVASVPEALLVALRLAGVGAADAERKQKVDHDLDHVQGAGWNMTPNETYELLWRMCYSYPPEECT